MMQKNFVRYYEKNNSPYSSLALFLIIENNLVENKGEVLVISIKLSIIEIFKKKI